MGRPFEADGPGVQVRLGAQERRLIARLLDEVDELLDDGTPSADEDPLVALVGFDLRLPDDLSDDLPDDLSDDGPHDVPDDLPGPSRGAPPSQDRGHRSPADRTGREDPALARLLPDGHRADPHLAKEFRRLTESGLRARKRRNLALASAALQRRGHLVLTAEEAGALLKGLTDLRLVLGERLGLRTDEDADLVAEALRAGADSDDPWVSAAVLYDVLTWWQEALVAALVR